MNMPDVIPLSWKLGAAAALLSGAWLWHSERVASAHTAGRNQAIAERAEADALALDASIKENTTMARKQAADNKDITKAKNEEIAPVVKRIYVDRVRFGSAICEPAAATSAESAASSNGANPPGRLVRSDIERDIRALKESVEQDLATGRACQSFLEKNNLTP